MVFFYGFSFRRQRNRFFHKVLLSCRVYRGETSLTWRNSELPQDPIGKDVLMGDLRFRITWLYGLQIENGGLYTFTLRTHNIYLGAIFFVVCGELLVLELPGIAHAISDDERGGWPRHPRSRRVSASARGRGGRVTERQAFVRSTATNTMRSGM